MQLENEKPCPDLLKLVGWQLCDNGRWKYELYGVNLYNYTLEEAWRYENGSKEEEGN